MNQETKQMGMGRVLIACILAILLAVCSPFIVITELMSLLVVVSVPAVCTMALYRWAGKAPLILSCALQLVFTGRMMGYTFMWMNLFASVLPLILLIFCEARPFFTRMKIALAAFCAGVVAAVAVMYATYGGNMIERVLSLLPRALRTVPADVLQAPMATLSAALGRELTVESFYKVFDDAIANLIPQYQLHLPGLLFSGAIITAVLCVGVGGRMGARRDAAKPESRVALKDWYLPASTTGGLLTMAVAAYAIFALGMQQGQTVYYTVYRIVLAAFCIQALASIARRLQGGAMKATGQKMMLIGFAVLALMGASVYLGVYGCASALLGSKGAIRLYLESKNKQ